MRAYRGAVSSEPRAPEPPDPADDAPAEQPFGDLTDAVVERADWANSEHRRLSLVRVELRDCRLTGSELAASYLSDVTFSDCRLDLVGLRSATLKRVVFRDCRMAEADLYEATLQDVTFERCELRGANLAAVKLDRVDMVGCDLLGASGIEDLRGVRMPWPDVVANAPLFAAALGIDVLD